MKDIEEIKKSIQILIKYPHAFGFSEYGDRGNGCSGRRRTAIMPRLMLLYSGRCQNIQNYISSSHLFSCRN